MTNKKMMFAPLLIAAGCLLAACSSDKIIARPDWAKDTKIIDNVDTKDNEMKLIYDAIKALGDTNSNILNKLLYDIATKKIGKVEELEKFGKSDATVTDEFKAFVNNHPYYQTTNNLKVVFKDGKPTKDENGFNDDEKYAISLRMVKDQYNQLQNDIAQKLYDQIKGGSYSEDNLFYEAKFIQSLRKDMQDVPSVEELEAKDIKPKEGIPFLPRRIEEETNELVPWSKHILDFLNADKVYDETKGNLYDKYVEEKLLKDIYRNYLIQNYVSEQRYSNLGRTYARKVKMVTVSSNIDSKERIFNMMTYFVKTYMINAPTNYNFEHIEDAMRGIVGISKSEIAYDLLVKGGKFTPIKVGQDTKTLDKDLIWTFHNMDGSETDQKTYVFKGTKLGELVEKYQKVYDITCVLDEEGNVTNYVHTLKKNYDTSAYNDLTGSGAYSIAHGLALKELEIKTTSYTKEGWYLKNGGLSDLGSDVRDRLFNISVSNIVDKDKTYDDTDYAKYITVAGKQKAFLTGKTPSTLDEDRIVLTDGDNYHIIEVQEAVSTSKLSTDEDNQNSYRYLRAVDGDVLASAITMNEIVYNVVKEVAAGDTYKSNAEQYYLMMSNIIFYDEDVYAYFKSQYPELFK